MSQRDIRYQLADMTSGECRWIGDESIHAYCRAPMVECLTPWGTLGWERGPATFLVATADGESGWMPLDRAVAAIAERIAV